MENKSAGVWVKASERLPDVFTKVFIKVNGVPNIGLYNKITGFFNTPLHSHPIEEIEWLDEGQLQSQQDIRGLIKLVFMEAQKGGGYTKETEDYFLSQLQSQQQEDRDDKWVKELENMPSLDEFEKKVKHLEQQEDKIKVISAKVKDHTLIAEVEVEDKRWISTEAFVAACKAADAITSTTGNGLQTIAEVNTFQELLKQQGFSILPEVEDKISDEEIAEMAEDNIKNFPFALSVFTKGFKACLQKGSEDKIAKAISWCEERINEANRNDRPEYIDLKEIKQFLQSL